MTTTMDGPVTEQMVARLNDSMRSSEQKAEVRTLRIRSDTCDDFVALSRLCKCLERQRELRQETLITVAVCDFDHTILPIFLLGAQRFVYENFQLTFRKLNIRLSGLYDTRELEVRIEKLEALEEYLQGMIYQFSAGALTMNECAKLQEESAVLTAPMLQERGLITGILHNKSTKDLN